MIIHSADFVSSFVNWKACPSSKLPEYAFIGRSNVGKSSLINMLTGRNGLAKTSNTPGKTQCINYFLINEAWHLVDLPGYGYARTSKTNREKWLQFTKAYLGQREQLVNTFILIDSRIPPQQIDIDFVNWMGGKGIPFSIVYTKYDKPKNSDTNIEAFEEILKQYWKETPVSFVSSSAKKKGREVILEYIEEINKRLSSI